MRCLPLSLGLLALFWAIRATFAGAAPATQPSAFDHVVLLHLPGIAGELSIDRGMLRGLEAGGYTGRKMIYDWTENDPGLGALLARERNEREAQLIADQIVQSLKRDPQHQIIITSHSGGTGLAVWALEKLPDDVKIQSLFLLSSALSPGYDLSRALRHVRGHVYSFNSENDVIVLKTGTKTFGTIDGKKVPAAGYAGFTIPPHADAKAYERLLQRPYEDDWLALGNDGDHIGSLAPRFAREVLAPLVLQEINAVPASQPAPRSGEPVGNAPETRPAP